MLLTKTPLKLILKRGKTKDKTSSNHWMILHASSHVFKLPNGTNAKTVCQSLIVLNMYVFFVLCVCVYICVYVCVCVCAPSPLTCLSRPLACQHASTSHTLGRSGSTRDVPAKSSSTSNLDPNTCNTKPWQPPTSHYQSYSIYRRYTSLSEAPPSLQTPVSSHSAFLLGWSAHHVFCVPCSLLNVLIDVGKAYFVSTCWIKAG